MNRDHWTKPYQSNGRDAHDYGNSGPILPRQDAYPVSWGERIIVSGIIILVTIMLVAFAAA